jgi:hypothetical protein
VVLISYLVTGLKPALPAQIHHARSLELCVTVGKLWARAMTYAATVQRKAIRSRSWPAIPLRHDGSLAWWSDTQSNRVPIQTKLALPSGRCSMTVLRGPSASGGFASACSVRQQR